MTDFTIHFRGSSSFRDAPIPHAPRPKQKKSSEVKLQLSCCECYWDNAIMIYTERIGIENILFLPIYGASTLPFTKNASIQLYLKSITTYLTFAIRNVFHVRWNKSSHTTHFINQIILIYLFRCWLMETGVSMIHCDISISTIVLSIAQNYNSN